MIAFWCNNCVHRLVEGLKVAICSVYKLQAITIDELLDKSYWVAYQLYAYLLADVWSGLSLAGNRKQGESQEHVCICICSVSVNL